MCSTRAKAARSRACSRRFGVVRADQRWTSNGEVVFAFTIDAVCPADIPAARPVYALFDADGVGHTALRHCMLATPGEQAGTLVD